jgi:hypothetical protein
MLVAHDCNSSYSGGKDQEDRALQPAQGNSTQYKKDGGSHPAGSFSARDLMQCFAHARQVYTTTELHLQTFGVGFETESCVYPRLALNLEISILSLQSIRITSRCHHACQDSAVLTSYQGMSMLLVCLTPGVVCRTMVLKCV